MVFIVFLNCGSSFYCYSWVFITDSCLAFVMSCFSMCCSGGVGYSFWHLCCFLTCSFFFFFKGNSPLGSVLVVAMSCLFDMQLRSTFLDVQPVRTLSVTRSFPKKELKTKKISVNVNWSYIFGKIFSFTFHNHKPFHLHLSVFRCASMLKFLKTI